MSQSIMEKTLRDLGSPPSRLPVLPLGHISCAKWFNDIMTDCALKPRYCKIFNKKQIYLFYGGLLYRPTTELKHDASSQPVGFLFHPEILRNNNKVRFYPFDTGAMAKGLYGKKLEGPFTQYKKNFEINIKGDPEVPSTFIYYAFGSNKNYLDGHPQIYAKTMPSPFPELFKFYIDPENSIDHRNCALECQFEDALAFDLKLMWVGYPETLNSNFQKIYDKIIPHRPYFWAYPSRTAFRPNDIAGQLEVKSKEHIERFLKNE